MGFTRLLDQFESCGFITLDENTKPLIRDEWSSLRHVLSDHLGKDVLARRLGYDADGIAEMRLCEEVLAPLYELTHQPK